MTTYIFEPLDHSKTQTRLVTIAPLGNLDESAPLQISIRTVTIPRRCLVTPLESSLEKVDLDSEDSDIKKPDFVALSYVWGSPDDPSELFVESAPEGANTISITRNLDVALRHMRSTIEQPVVFWIDAICIDQGNLEERSYQVAFMDTIYTIAEGTSVWLGLEENNSDRAIDILSYVGERVSRNADGTFERAADAPPRELEEPTWESMDEPIPLGEDDIHAVVSFFERPWFTRLWIRQEIALADKAQIQCGTRVMDWDCFHVAGRCWFSKLLPKSLSPNLHRRMQVIRKSIIHICDANLLKYRYERMRFQHEGVCSTDPRDMIYGVRSLLMEEDKSLGVRPNYTLEAADVFMDVCVRIVERESRAYFLETCELSSISVPNLPSWVPDWSTKMTARTYLVYSWSACGFISANATYLGDKVLRVSGTQIDEITSIRVLYDQPDDEIFKDRSVLIKNIWNCRPEQDRIHSPYDGQQSMIDAYCRTFTRDYFFETHYAPRSSPSWAYSKRPSFEEAKEALEKIWSLDEDLSSLEDLVNDASIWNFIVNGCSCCYDRCLFITKDGYIGLAPRDIKLGDIVSVILGCDVPLILRQDPSSTAKPDKTRWKTVGACYTNGLMSGEAIYGGLPSHYQAVYCAETTRDERICGTGYALLDNRTEHLQNDPAAVLEEVGIKPSVWSREPHRLEVSESVLRQAGVKLRDFLLI